MTATIDLNQPATRTYPFAQPPTPPHSVSANSESVATPSVFASVADNSLDGATS